MRHLNLSVPTHLTEALRTNMSGGKTVAQLLAEAAARRPVHVARRAERAHRCRRRSDLDRAGRAREATPSKPATFPARGSCRAASSNCASTRNCRTPRCASSSAASSARSRRWRRPRCASWASCARRARRRHEGMARSGSQRGSMSACPKSGPRPTVCFRRTFLGFSRSPHRVRTPTPRLSADPAAPARGGR